MGRLYIFIFRNNVHTLLSFGLWYPFDCGMFFYKYLFRNKWKFKWGMRHGNVLVICNWLYLWQIKWWLAKDMIACLVIVKTLIITSCIHHYRVWNLPLKCTSNQVRSLCWWFFLGLLQWFMRSNLTLLPKVPKEVDNGVNKSILSSTHLEVSNIDGWLGYGPHHSLILYTHKNPQSIY